MPSFTTILSATMPVFLIVAIGFFMHRRGMLGEKIEVGVMRLGLNFLIPCFILTLIPGNPALKTISSAAWAIGLGYVLVVTGFLLALIFGLASKIRRGEGLRTFAISAGIQNYGFLPLPIAIELFPENLGPRGLVFVFGIGVEMAMWTVGLMILTGKVSWKSVINGPFIAVVVALIFNFTNTYEYIPGVISTTMDMMGRCAVPMSILMIGATMGRFFEKGIFHDALRTSLVSIFVRLVLMAGAFLLCARYLPISDDLRKLLVIQAAMPAAIFPIILARLYGGQPQVAIQVVLATSMVSMISSPLVIAWGLHWIGG